jgi:hypothetical protein
VSPVLKSAVKQITQYFIHHGAPPSTAQSHAFGYIGQLVSEQASRMAYIDVFHIWAIFTAMIVPIVLLLIRRAHGTGRASAMH